MYVNTISSVGQRAKQGTFSLGCFQQPSHYGVARPGRLLIFERENGSDWLFIPWLRNGCFWASILELLFGILVRDVLQARGQWMISLRYERRKFNYTSKGITVQDTPGRHKARLTAATGQSRRSSAQRTLNVWVSFDFSAIVKKGHDGEQFWWGEKKKSIYLVHKQGVCALGSFVFL